MTLSTVSVGPVQCLHYIYYQVGQFQDISVILWKAWLALMLITCSWTKIKSFSGHLTTSTFCHPIQIITNFQLKCGGSSFERQTAIDPNLTWPIVDIINPTCFFCDLLRYWLRAIFQYFQNWNSILQLIDHDLEHTTIECWWGTGLSTMLGDLW